MLFVRRTERPTEPNTNYFSYRNVYYRCGLGMPNCPAYALGRFHEITGIWLPIAHNAEDWAVHLAKAGYTIAKKPLLGAVGIYRNGKAGVDKAWEDGCGHVIIVEAIKPNGDIVSSNSGYYRSPAGVLPQNDKKYQALFWYEQTFKASKGYAWTSSTTHLKYDLIGFVLPPVFQSEPRTLMTFKGATGIYLDAGTEFKYLTLSNNGDSFKYDGVYKIGTDNKKWLHGIHVKKSGVKPDLTGWVSADKVC